MTTENRRYTVVAVEQSLFLAVWKPAPPSRWSAPKLFRQIGSPEGGSIFPAVFTPPKTAAGHPRRSSAPWEQVKHLSIGESAPIAIGGVAESKPANRPARSGPRAPQEPIQHLHNFPAAITISPGPRQPTKCALSPARTLANWQRSLRSSTGGTRQRARRNPGNQPAASNTDRLSFRCLIYSRSGAGSGPRLPHIDG